MAGFAIKQGQSVAITLTLDEQLGDRKLLLGIYKEGVMTAKKTAVVMLSTEDGSLSLLDIENNIYHTEISWQVTKKLDAGLYRLELLCRDNSGNITMIGRNEILLRVTSSNIGREV